ncbi:SAM-dependent methyltransferase [Pseudonocardia sp. CNS-139]|nr:SAM-dependent methyltransferase [Pseudonocardia sp. CNS-139]
MSDPETSRQEHGNGPQQLPPEIDITVPSVARGYDYGLGGKNNFEVDRAGVNALVQAFPGALELGFANRRFLQRGVRYLVAEAGIRQILDIGSGLPTVGNVHEIAHEIDPATRVVYVDHDPIVLAHGRALLADNQTTTVIQADAVEPETIFEHPETKRFIDFDKPFAVLLAGLLHHLSDEQDPQGITDYVRSRLTPGSYLLVTNFLNDDDPRAAEVQAIINNGFGTGFFRTWEQQRAYFDGLELVEPGLTYANDWRPDGHTSRDSPWHTFNCGGIGRKP